jgi:Flp pilus assembly pilin Flp
MLRGLNSLWNDEAGFVVSSELALVSTVGVLGMVAGLSEASNNVNGELQDVGAAFGSLDQSYAVTLSTGPSVRYQDRP